MVIEDGKDSKGEMEGVKKMEVKSEEWRGKKRWSKWERWERWEMELRVLSGKEERGEEISEDGGKGMNVEIWGW